MFTAAFLGSLGFIHCFYRIYEWHRIWLCLAINYWYVECSHGSMYRAIAEVGYPNCAVLTFTLYFCRSLYGEMQGDSQVHLTIAERSQLADICCPLFWNLIAVF